MVDLQIIVCIRRCVILVYPIYSPLFAIQPETVSKRPVCWPYWYELEGGGEHCFVYIEKPFMNVRVPTFQYRRLWSQPPMLSANSLMLVCSSLCLNVVLLRPFHTKKEIKITGSQVRAADGGWSNTSHRKRFRSLFVATAVSYLIRPSNIMKDNISGQHSSSLVLNKRIELQHALYIWRERLLF